MPGTRPGTGSPWEGQLMMHTLYLDWQNHVCKGVCMVGWKGVCMVGFSSRHDDYQIFSLPCPPSLILATAHNQGALIVSSPSTNICLRGWWKKGKSSTIVSPCACPSL